MLALWEFWQEQSINWYVKIVELCNSKKNLKIFVYLNILVELNKQFHYNHVDIIAIGSTLDVTISKRHYLIETPIFQQQFFQEIVFRHK
jgi:hypothetical protein